MGGQELPWYLLTYHGKQILRFLWTLFPKESWGYRFTHFKKDTILITPCPLEKERNVFYIMQFLIILNGQRTDRQTCFHYWTTGQATCEVFPKAAFTNSFRRVIFTIFSICFLGRVIFTLITRLNTLCSWWFSNFFKTFFCEVFWFFPILEGLHYAFLCCGHLWFGMFRLRYCSVLVYCVWVLSSHDLAGGSKVT